MMTKTELFLVLLGIKKTMTIAEQLKVTEFPFTIKDSRGNITYYEDSDKFWIKREFDSKGNETYYENSYKYWIKREFDSKGNETYYKNSNNFD